MHLRRARPGNFAPATRDSLFVARTLSFALRRRPNLPESGCGHASGLRWCKRAWWFFAFLVCARVLAARRQQHPARMKSSRRESDRLERQLRRKWSEKTSSYASRYGAAGRSIGRLGLSLARQTHDGGTPYVQDYTQELVVRKRFSFGGAGGSDGRAAGNLCEKCEVHGVVSGRFCRKGELGKQR